MKKNLKTQLGLATTTTIILIVVGGILLGLGIMYLSQQSKLEVNSDCEISGRVILPNNVQINIEEMSVMYGIIPSVPVDKSGKFCIKKEDLKSDDREFGVSMSVWLNAKNDRPYALFFLGTIFPQENYIELSSRSTAADLVYTLFMRSDNKEGKRIYDIIYSTKETEAFAKYLDLKLANDLWFLTNVPELIDNEEYQGHIQDIIKVVAEKIK